ncbi:hypothetical protein V6N12_021147 [Hibiscus sabdariffa]|uniref:RNase H type-1 domain-containing protein n=1 Tax=Hibiscus sabdariffa TaxID=183260 RepID=A0ABR2ASR8_9ROSI
MSWCKLNTDKYRCITTGCASCGGVLHNEKGDSIMSFSRFIGVWSTLDVELWGVLEGLNHAWNLGYLKIEVELDSLTVVRILLRKVGAGTHYNLINHVHEILRQDWVIMFSHIFCEANTIADELAKMDTYGHMGGWIFWYPPPGIRDLVLHEIGLISTTYSYLVLFVDVTCFI